MKERHLRHVARGLMLCALMASHPAWSGNVQFGTGQPAVNYGSKRPMPSERGAMVDAGGRSTWAPAPNVFRAILPPVTVEESRRAVERNGRALPSNLNQGAAPSGGRPLMTAMRVGGDANPLGPASISELARALRNHPDLIYQYVRNNIEFYPVWGIQKGALGTVLDNQGTGMDQATLMIELLRASGYTANLVHHHQVGIAGYNGASYVDLPSNSVSTVHPRALAAEEDAMFANWGMHLSILESTTVNQATGVPAVSTVKLIDKAAQAGQKFLRLTKANYAGLKSSLLNCASLDAAFAYEVNAGRAVVTPSNCALAEGTWKGSGYFTVAPGYLGSIISGGLSGGYSSNPLSAAATNSSTSQNARSQNNAFSQSTIGKPANNGFGDPIDMVQGHYLFDREDLISGVGSAPASLSFQRLYSSGLRTQDGPLGKGWNHNLNIGVSVGSDGFQGMGEQSALSAVGTLIEHKAAYDLLLDTSRPLDKLIVAAIGQNWFGEQLTNNTAVVSRGLNGEVFARLPDGSYSAPRNNASRLVKNSDGTWTYETKGRAKIQFDAAGLASTYTEPSGLQVKYTYSGGLLSRAENSLGRWLSFTYNGSRISQVNDHAGRFVKYGYDASGNLTSFTDTLNNVTRHEYDLPGRMTRFFNPSAPTAAVVTNVYDSLGRIKTRMRWSFFGKSMLLLSSLAAHAEGAGMARVCYIDFDVETLTPITVENICSRGDVRSVPLSDRGLLKVVDLLEKPGQEFIGAAVRLRITATDGRDIAADQYGNVTLLVEENRSEWAAEGGLKVVLNDLLMRYPELAPQVDGDPFRLR